MPPDRIRFRCFACNQLLAVGPSKVGKIVACPKCAEELIVPDPDEAADSPLVTDFPDVSEMFSAGELEEATFGIQIATEATLTTPKPTPSKPPSEPIPDLSQLADDFVRDESDQEADPITPEIDVPLPAKLTASRTIGRGRDVTIPRAVVLNWSMFVILGQVATFVAGLMVGHFVWKTP